MSEDKIIKEKASETVESEVKPKKTTESKPKPKTTKKAAEKKAVTKAEKPEVKQPSTMVTTADPKTKEPEPEPEDANDFPFIDEAITPEEQKELKKKSGIITTRHLDRTPPKVNKDAWKKVDESITTRDIIGKKK